MNVFVKFANVMVNISKSRSNTIGQNVGDIIFSRLVRLITVLFMIYSQVVLSFERFAADVAHVLPLVAVRQFVFGQSRRVPKHFPAGL